ncbi:MAG TPA: ABC transporter permease [Candidatus Saccharimonadia bacterium]|nr:ABC transporter permease [Candidatus Saccharimonadia bacterium]
MRLYRRVFSKQNRALLAELVRTDFKLRYQGSFLGYAWSLLRPLFMFAILYVVFVKAFPLGKGIPHYPVYLFMGIMLWNFFLEMSVQGLGSIVGRGDLIRKIRIPRWIVVFSSSISALINLGLNLLVLVVFMAFNHVDIMRTIIVFPLILTEIYLFALGISLLLAALYVKFRDISYIWDVVLQAGFYLTPILYPLSKVKNLLFEKLILLNPMAQALQDARYTVISHDKAVVTTARIFDGGWYRLIPFIFVLVVLTGGLVYFKGQARTFAENI